MKRLCDRTELEVIEDQLNMLVHQTETVGRIEAIRARMAQSCEEPKPTRKAPVYWQRPAKGYKTPSYGQWKRWLERRIGILPLVDGQFGDTRVLCICCGIPISASTGDKTRRGTSGKVTLEDGGLSKIVVGAFVKFLDEEYSQDWTTGPHGFMETANSFNEDSEETTKYAVVTHRALGCSDCQREYLRRKAETKAENTRRTAAYHATRREYLAKVEQLIAMTPDMDPGMARKLRNYTGDVPKDRTAYIAVDVKDLSVSVEAYWQAAEQE